MHASTEPQAPSVPGDFWRHPDLREAFAARHMGRVIRAYRRHPWHGRALAQEVVAEWLGTTQPRLSRIEGGSRTEHLDLLMHWATVLGIPERHLWFALSHGARAVPGLAVASQLRSQKLAAEVARTGRAAYQPDHGAIAALQDFARSPKRVFLLAGGPGVGKTTLGLRMVEHLADTADIQVHHLGDWADTLDGLTAEILRYGGQPVDGDAAGDLELACASLTRTCLVVVDGVTSQRTWDRVATAIDRLLRQVLTDHLRFVVLARTPPDLDVTGAPLVAASLHGSGPEPGPGHRMAEWTTAQAERAWDLSTVTSGRFAELPEVVRQLARSPLSMRLMIEVGSRASCTSFDLLDAFVRGALRGVDDDRAVVLGAAARLLPDVADVAERLAIRPGVVGPLPALYDVADRTRFLHDVVAEFLLAGEIAKRIVEHDSTAGAVRTVNDLGRAAASSGSARGVLGFVLDGLDRTDPGLLRSVLTAPAADQRVTVPALLRFAGAGHAAFLTTDVLLACARRCEHVESVTALLAVPALPGALGGSLGGWLVEQIRHFGSAVWADVAVVLDHATDQAAAESVLVAADLSNAGDALFIARHVGFFASVQHDAPTIAALIDHTDWRVRAALAEGMDDLAGVGAAHVVDRLVRDPDYKVRAAAARAALSAEPESMIRNLERLLRDDVWHVRASVLLAVAGRPPTSGPTSDVVDALRGVVDSEPAWQVAPVHVAAALARAALHLGAPDLLRDLSGAAVDRAVFPLLREGGAGTPEVPGNVLHEVRQLARRSTSWVVQREADGPVGRLLDGEQFRRLRGGRSVQIALDMQDLDQAVAVARAAAVAGAHLVEVGDPLIKQFGLAAVSAVKQAVPEVPVIAEMMSADWGRDQVELAAQAGADVVLLIGPASTTSVAAAVAAGRRLGLPIMLDTPSPQFDQDRIREVERLGIDALVVTTNIDHGHRGGRPLESANRLRGWTQLPVAVSGGFSAHDRDILADPAWDIVIVGRGVCESIDPGLATRVFVDAVGRAGASL